MEPDLRQIEGDITAGSRLRRDLPGRASQALATGNFERSEQMASEKNWLKLSLVPLDMSVAFRKV